MSRTNIEIDEELIERVMRAHGFATKREAVDRALRELDVRPLSSEEMLALEGSGWEGNLDRLRRMDPALERWIADQDADRSSDG